MSISACLLASSVFVSCSIVYHSVMQVDKTGSKFVTVSTDRRIRVFKFKTGKLMRTYDESLEVCCESQL